jgi:hypothetical protein
MIYFARIDHLEKAFIKVGYTNGECFKRRHSSMSVGNPFKIKLYKKLSLVACKFYDQKEIPEIEKQIERSLHKFLTEYNVRGEWFRYEPNHCKYKQLIDIVEMIDEGYTDVYSLNRFMGVGNFVKSKPYYTPSFCDQRLTTSQRHIKYGRDVLGCCEGVEEL